MTKKTKRSKPGAKPKDEKDKVIPVLVYYKKEKVDDAGGLEKVRGKVKDFLTLELG